MTDEKLAGLRLLARNKDRIRVLTDSLKESEAENTYLRKEVDALTPRPRKKLGKVRSKRKSKAKSRRSFLIGLTDNHITQVVDPKLTNGNRHNEQISRARLISVVTQAAALIRDAEANHGIDGIGVWLGGDSMVNSDLHPHFRRMTPYEPLEELDVCFEVFKSVFDTFIEGLDGRVPDSVHCSLSNHGRDCKKEEISAEIAYRRSYDVTLAKMLAREIPIPFDIERSYFGNMEVGGVRALLHHGHMLTMKDHPSGLLLPNWTQLNKRLSQPRHRGSSLYLSGHYHTASHMISDQFALVSAGSTVGQDGYSYQLGFPDHPPSQPLIEIAEGKVIQVHHLTP